MLFDMIGITLKRGRVGEKPLAFRCLMTRTYQ